MVSQIAAATTIKIAEQSLSFAPDSIVKGMSITWGRRDLFSPPAQRTLSATVIFDDTQLYDHARWLLGQPIEARIGQQVVFVGHVDSVDVVHAPYRGEDYWLIRLRAVEATGWNPHLGKKFTTRVVNSYVLRRSLEQQSPHSIPTLINPPEDNHRAAIPFAFNQAVELDVKKGWEMLICAGYPGAHATWSPDYRTVGRTIHRLDEQWQDFSIPAHAVMMDSPSWNAKDFPGTIIFSTGGLHSDKKIHSTVTRGGTASGAAVEMNFPARLSDQAVLDPAVTNGLTQLLGAQLTSPRSFEIMDTDLSAVQAEKVFTTSEGFTRFQVPGGWFDTQWGINPSFSMIGGVITIAHDRSQHAATCIYAAKTYPNRRHDPTWATAVGTWNTTNRTWKT